jgi:hypothetical protein
MAFWKEKRRVCSMFKILSTYISWKKKKYIKCNIWRVTVHPSYVWDARFLKVNFSDRGQSICAGYTKYSQTHYTAPQTSRHSQALQPMQGLGRLKKSPPTISIIGLAPPISDSQPLCIPHHSIHPSIRGLAFPLAFRPVACPRWFSYMVDYLALILYVLPIWA